ncbi:MAG: SPOR domain-containing protein [Chitinophagales bacterium]|nr:SPOR domain-containing protein [Chitinophagales bacterium]
MKLVVKTLRPYLLFAIFFLPIHIFSQVRMEEPDEIASLVKAYLRYRETVQAEEGYRIQITYTSDREEAYRAKAKLYKEFEEVPSYIEYDQPNYKLRLGDFRTRLEATAFLQEVIKIYPGAFIVKDRIKIH